MKPQDAIEYLKKHLDKSSTHKWKECEYALLVLEKNIKQHKQLADYCLNLEKVIDDFHASLSD
jgi:hypothetical protein